ncbi:MAG: 2-phospho-L-lactate transferase [Rhodospirillaceae bacterium]|nr:2-phospho-L-lactate transferase [Rhodospirillaceae bacterium]
MSAADFDDAVIVLSGGVGGAKLVQGFLAAMDPAKLIVVANTADDFEHLGLSISPDLDTLMYTLAGVHDEQQGWGRRDETWSFMEALEGLGGDTWFRLGDRDLATHVERTRRRQRGETLSQIAADLCRQLGVKSRLLPMSDDSVRTRFKTAEGWLDFQDYFVRQRCAPRIEEIRFEGAQQAALQPTLSAALHHRRLRAVVIAPSNPFISIEPILSVGGVRAAITGCAAPVIAVSPIIAGRAVKGPTEKMMREFGLPPGVDAVLHRYDGLIDAMLVDIVDANTVMIKSPQIFSAPLLMRTSEDKILLARAVLDVVDRFAGEARSTRAKS